MPKVVRESTLLGNQKAEVHPAKSSARDRGRSHHNLRGHVRREEELIPIIPGLATTQGGGSGENSPRASFPTWGTI